MPVKVAKRGDKFRVIEAATGNVAKNASGSALDGGGHTSKAAAQHQANAVNAAKHNKQRS